MPSGVRGKAGCRWPAHCFDPGVTATAGWMSRSHARDLPPRGSSTSSGHLLTRRSFGACVHRRHAGALRAVLPRALWTATARRARRGPGGLRAVAASRRSPTPTGKARNPRRWPCVPAMQPAGWCTVRWPSTPGVWRCALPRAGTGPAALLDGWIDPSVAGWLIPVAALGLIGYAIQQFASAWRGKLDSSVSTGEAARENGPVGDNGQPLRDRRPCLRVRRHRRAAAARRARRPRLPPRYRRRRLAALALTSAQRRVGARRGGPRAWRVRRSISSCTHATAASSLPERAGPTSRTTWDKSPAPPTAAARPPSSRRT